MAAGGAREARQDGVGARVWHGEEVAGVGEQRRPGRLVVVGVHVQVRLGEDEGVVPSVRNINKLWGKVREVSLDLDGVTVNGRFLGVDDHGGLRLETRSHKHIVYESHQVRQLHEV